MKCTFTCEYCGNEFQGYQHSGQTHRFCSRSCWKHYRQENNTVEYTCAQCGQLGRMTRADYERSQTHFCSNECFKEYRTAQTQVCPICGKEFKNHGQDRTACSKECYGIYVMQNKIVKTCEVCGVEMRLTPCYSNQRFCSRECRDIAHNVQAELQCAWCGQTFRKHRFALKDGLVRGNFCGHSCYHEWLRGHGDIAISTSSGSCDRPNKLEQRFWDTYPELEYTGDGKVWIDLFYKGRMRKKNPDFIVPGTNQVVELFGDYWHKDDDPEELKAAYSQVGYECQVYWEHEIERLLAT